MTEYTSVPRNYGLVLIVAGLLVFIPMLAFLLEQWTDTGSGWNIVMFIFTFLALSMAVVLLVVGTNIAWYHDPEDDEKTHEEIAESSEYYPKEPDENEKN